MTLSPMDQQGPFIPFDKPMVPPVPSVLSDPLVALCFNEDWRPAIMGALKVLARPETWIGTIDDIKSVVTDAMLLLGETDEDCAPPLTLDCSPVFIGTASGFMDYNNTATNGWVADDCRGCGQTGRTFMFVVQLNALGTIAENALVFEDNDTGLPTGIHVCEIRGYQTDTTLFNVWNFTYEDCFGNTHQEQQLGIQFHKTDIEVRRWGLSSLAPFAYSMTIDGPILCTEA